jgi:hypothetical protein
LAAIPPLSSGAGQASGFGHRLPETAAQARVAAQRAFFQEALGRAQATNSSAPNPGQKQAATGHAGDTQDAEPANRIPRPGSIINIVV